MYLRKSTEPQALSIEGQETEIREFVKNKDIKIVAKYKDVKSGEIFDRPDLKRMLEDVKTDLWDGIIAWSLDRISRSADHHGYIRTIFKNYNKEILTVKDSDTFWERHIKIGISEDEQKRRKDGIIRGTKEAIKKGHYCNRPPLGYKLDKKTKKLKIDHDKAFIIRALFRDYKSNEFGLKRLSNKYGIKKATLQYLLQNPIYHTGEIIRNGKVIDKVEPLLKKSK